MGRIFFTIDPGRICRLLLGGSLLVLILGCQEAAEIRGYQVPRPESAPADFRRLAAIVARGDKVWFFKLDGPVKAVGDQKDNFQQYVQSLRFHDSGKEPISWKLPEGWRQEPGDGQMRYATIRLGPKDQPLELTVTPLDREQEADSILKNVNRWRDQLGLAPLRETELEEVTRPLKVHGELLTVVDISGRLSGTKGMAVASGKKPAQPASAGLDLSYQLPGGWVPLPRSGMRLAAFQVLEKDRKAEITVIPAGGDLLANVNRWRVEQLGLEAVSLEQLKKDLLEIKVAGEAAAYVDLTGRAASGETPNRILAVALPLGRQSLFFKMSGPADLVSLQKPAFEAFVRSVKIGQGKGN